MHPGTVKTGIMRHFSWWVRLLFHAFGLFLKVSQAAAGTSLAGTRAFWKRPVAEQRQRWRQGHRPAADSATKGGSRKGPSSKCCWQCQPSPKTPLYGASIHLHLGWCMSRGLLLCHQDTRRQGGNSVAPAPVKWVEPRLPRSSSVVLPSQRQGEEGLSLQGPSVGRQVLVASRVSLSLPLSADSKALLLHTSQGPPLRRTGD